MIDQAQPPYYGVRQQRDRLVVSSAHGFNRFDSIGFPCPPDISDHVWAAACALAADRHPNARYPQPQDVRDAGIVVRAAVSHVLSVSQTDADRIFVLGGRMARQPWA